MASAKAVKQRIRSVKNTAQITKAMEVVSATKMRRSQEFAIKARPYAVASLNLLRNLVAKTKELPGILERREVRKCYGLLVITSDKGLAGALNANVIRKAEAWVKARRINNEEFILVTVGKRARDYFEHKGVPIHKSFWGFGDMIELEDTLPVAEVLIQGFLNHTWDELSAVYTHFRTTLLQEAVVREVLPITEAGVREIVEGIVPEKGRYSKKEEENFSLAKYTYEYTYEPSPEVLLTALVPQLLRMHVHHMILESNASEHSARMVAMKNASDNAKELITDLTLTYNKARQASITRELSEITAGKEALESS
ncbi:MAG: ATP synthase F1 subunit gamma [Parcubacteria group bacterium]|nr:ATP synthase F1 subunit gamma [Parcubacteria group bacterium]